MKLRRSLADEVEGGRDGAVGRGAGAPVAPRFVDEVGSELNKSDAGGGVDDERVEPGSVAWLGLGVTLLVRGGSVVELDGGVLTRGRRSFDVVEGCVGRGAGGVEDGCVVLVEGDAELR